jgi:hypothetical protein
MERKNDDTKVEIVSVNRTATAQAADTERYPGIF